MLGNPNVFGSPGVAGAKIAPHAWRTLYKSKIGFAWRWDHPRIRGEHEYTQTGIAYIDGIIPAYAGNTTAVSNCENAVTGSSPHTRGTRSPRLSAAERCWDHPRIRGEHAGAVDQRPDQLGIIPAYAGNTWTGCAIKYLWRGSSPHTRGTRTSYQQGLAAYRDHPRIRGEHDEPVQAALPDLGIIPAYAGNTEHPDARMKCPTGSSPHTRGTLLHGGVLSDSSGDHPRIRGEHLVFPFDFPFGIGIIPAYAGNTLRWEMHGVCPMGSSPHTRGTRSWPRSSSRWRRDHPRIRGEHQPETKKKEGFSGIIPAYAGNTHFAELVHAEGEGSSPHTRGTPLVSDRTPLVAGDHPRIRGEHRQRDHGR